MKTRSLPLGSLFAIAAGIAACSDPSVPEQDASMDAAVEDRVSPRPDVATPPVDTGVVTRCTGAADCDDGVACTDDACGMDGVCTHTAVNERCSDSRFCNGVETCDTGRGCVAGMVPSCDDMNANTSDRCDEAANACRSDALDNDGDGDPAVSAGGRDCDDNDRTRSSLEREVCNSRDDNCNGMVDDGALNSCGNCDPNCRGVSTGGMGGMGFDPGGQRGVEVDPMAGGLLVRAQSRTGDYLWIPNTGESTISKWDAAMVPPREIARYRVGLARGECPGACCYNDGCNQISRVAVDGFGDLYVASRAFGGIPGSVSKIAGDRGDCVDRNGNGMIDTSSGPADVRPYDQDECVLWTSNVGAAASSQLRALTVDSGDAMFPQGYPWAGSYTAQAMYKLNPTTGAVIATVPIPTVSPYGAVATSDRRLWVSTLETANLAEINTTTNTLTRVIPYPGALRSNCANGYGVTADSAARVWITGWTCRDALGYNTATAQWTRVDTTSLVGGTAGRGITPGPDGYIYMAASSSGDVSSRVVRWLATDFVPGGTIAAGRVELLVSPNLNGPAGIGFDRSGQLWLAHYQAPSPLLRINTTTRAATTYSGPNRPYSYSDFTGAVRRTVIGTGTYTQQYDTQCDNPTLAQLSWDAVTPAGTSLSFNIQSAATAAGLGGSTSVAVAQAPRDASPRDVTPALTGAMVTPRRFVRVTVTFNPTTMPIASPVLRGMSLTWRCPYTVPAGG
jgi:sugar lactone lactonase YvrE